MPVPPSITLIRSRHTQEEAFQAHLVAMEDYCAAHTQWKSVWGARLFSPRDRCHQFYGTLHRLTRPFLRRRRPAGALVSLGMQGRRFLLAKNFPHFAFGYRPKVLWVYDVWEPRWPQFEKTLQIAAIDILLLSSAQATDHFRGRRLPFLPPENIHWLPETLDPATYRHKPWAQRTRDVLSFGRRYDRFHDLFEIEANRAGVHYDYGNLPTHEDLVEALSDAKFCVCFPLSLTNSQSAGGVSTMTARYLQAMASKCLILGESNEDLRRLLDYNPVVEVDWSDPVGQIQAILREPEPYAELIERNFQTVWEKFHFDRAIEVIEGAVTQFSAANR